MTISRETFAMENLRLKENRMTILLFLFSDWKKIAIIISMVRLPDFPPYTQSVIIIQFKQIRFFKDRYFPTTVGLPCFN